jgi:sugar lactone lactonase YvrE
VRSRLAAALFVCFVLAGSFAARAEDGAPEPIPDDVRQWAEEVIADRAGQGREVAEFPADAEWLNVSRKLRLKEDLRGKVVLLDFWCYCCINCIHVLPDLAYLESRYEGEAFAVIGVHSAKFQNEKDTENIRDAVLRYEIRHPVVNDGDFRIWREFGARAWPTFVLLGPDGRVIGSLSGEGHRQELDALVTAALDHFADSGLLDASPLPIRLAQASRPSGVLAYPGKVLADGEGGRLFVADSNHHRILELSLDGTFRRAWGSGDRGLADGAPDEARFFRPQGMALRGGALWVADTENHAIRRIDLESGHVETVAGTGVQGRFIDAANRFDMPMPPATSFPALEVALSSPWDLEFVGPRIVIAMAGCHQLWQLDPATGTVSHFAGDGTERRLDDEDLVRAAFAQPSGLAWDGRWLYVADSESSSIVRVGVEGPVETVAGASTNPRDLFHFGDDDGRGYGPRFQHPLGVGLHDGLVYVADSYNHKVKTVDPRTREVRTRWGTGTSALADDPPQFSEPGGIDVSGGHLYVADTNNHAIRVVDIETGATRTLDLSSVPIPQTAARSGGRGGAWPDLPGTVRTREADVRVVKPDIDLEVVVDLQLPEGWKLTEGAPSAVRVEGWGEVVEAPIEELDFRLGVRTPAAAEVSELVVRLLYYVCEDEGTCRIRSREFTLPVEIAPDGGEGIPIEDRFEP